MKFWYPVIYRNRGCGNMNQLLNNLNKLNQTIRVRVEPWLKNYELLEQYKIVHIGNITSFIYPFEHGCNVHGLEKSGLQENTTYKKKMLLI